MSIPSLTINNLNIKIESKASSRTLVELSNLVIQPSKITAIVGESGSGKTITALSILNLLAQNNAFKINGTIQFGDLKLLENENYSPQMQSIRGNNISMIFQEPMTSLNPLHPIKRQIKEIISIHSIDNTDDSNKKIEALMDNVGLKEHIHCYPHELSGGQRQRAMIAMALANKPKLLIADEPTTALDIKTQDRILSLICSLKETMGMSVMLITHDLNLVRSIADHVYIMKSGHIIESGTTKEIMNTPKQDYTKTMLASIPNGNPVALREKTDEILSIDRINVQFPIKKGIFRFTKGFVKPVQNITFSVHKGTTLGIIGESGSGKTTLIRAILRLIKSTGAITYNNIRLDLLTKNQLRNLRKEVQVVFQDPFSSLNPRMSIREIINEGPLTHYNTQDNEAIEQTFEKVGLTKEMLDRYPHQFSGGQRQRIAIARALILNPKVIILDEPTSALDVTIQLQILELLKELQKELGITYIFISHDINVIKSISHNIAVLYKGEFVEYGTASDIVTAPKHEYTSKLLEHSKFNF